MTRNGSRLVALFAEGLLLAATAAAQRTLATEYSAKAAAMSPTMSAEARHAMNERIEAVNAKFREAHGGQSPEQFGLECCQILQIPATSFNPANNASSYSTPGNGFIWPNTSDLRATVTLPSGAALDFLDLYYKDSDANSNICAELRALTGPTFSGDPPATTVIATTCSSGSPGFGYAVGTASLTINNNVFYDSSGAQYIIAITHSPSAAPGLWFKAVDIWWHREVSPAPASATFTDVPTNHQFFQFVEALVEAGITVGYGDGRYGVNDPITRGQMAVFLAKALGLYWPL